MNQERSSTLVVGIAIAGILIMTGIGWYVIDEVKTQNEVFHSKVYSQYEYLLADFDIERRVLLMEFNSLMQGVQEISQTAKSFWETPVSRGNRRPRFIGAKQITTFATDSTFEWGTYEIANIADDHFTVIAKGNYTGLEFSAIINKDGLVSWKPVKMPPLDRVKR